MNACTNPDILKVIYFFQIIIDIVKIIIPIGLIVMGSIDFSKSVISNDETAQKKNIKLFIKRIIYAVLIFIIPWIVKTLMISLGDLTEKINFTDCLENTKNIEYYEELAKEKEESSNNKNESKQKLIEETNKIENNSIKKAFKEADKNDNNSNTNSQEITPSEGSIIGQTYTLSDEQLRAIAYLCQCEQGSPTGAAAEASLMANRFELYGKSYGTDADSLYRFIRNEGWWYDSKNRMDNPGNPYDSVLTAVYEVLILGKRTLPLYVDEHDCIDCGSSGFDIIKIVNNGKVITDKKELLNKSNYVNDQTILYNRYGAIYTFHSFPTPTSDPFGYTSKAKNKYNSLNN